MATKVKIELIYRQNLPAFAVDMLEATADQLESEPDRLLAWLTEIVMEGGWDASAQVSVSDVWEDASPSE